MASYNSNKNKATEFFENIDEKHEHSKAKHWIYRRYLDAFVHIIHYSGNRVIIFDGFAGQGIYKKDKSDSDQTETEKDYHGSPLLALESCLTYLHNKKKCNCVLIFVEENEINYEELVKNIKNTVEKTEEISDSNFADEDGKFSIKKNTTDIKFYLEVNNDKFENHIDNVLKYQSDKSRLLSIVDPFGYKVLSNPNIPKLVGVNKEIIVTLMVKQMNQYKNSAKHLENISNALRVDEEELKNIKSELDIAIMFGENLKKSSINPIYFKIKNIKNCTSFMLVFISNNKKGFYEMKKTFYYKSNNNDDIKDLNDYEFSLYKDDVNTEMQLKNNTEKIENLLIEKFKSKENISINEIKDFIEDETPYINYKSALISLEKKNKISVCTDSAFKRTKISFPDRNDFKISFLKENPSEISSQQIDKDQSQTTTRKRKSASNDIERRDKNRKK